MADPQLTDYYRALVIFEGKTGAPRDQYVNSFVFKNTVLVGNQDDVADRIRTAMIAFYAATNPGYEGRPAGVRLDSFMPTGILKPTVKVKCYDLGQPKGERFPFTREFPITGTATSPLPEENAVCLSLVTDMNRPRRRGRIYFGPLAINSLSLTGTQGTSVTVQLREALIASAETLRRNNDLEWSVLSQRDQVARRIQGGWVDERFDHIRRRGGDPLTRAEFGTWGGRKSPVG